MYPLLSIFTSNSISPNFIINTKNQASNNVSLNHKRPIKFPPSTYHDNFHFHRSQIRSRAFQQPRIQTAKLGAHLTWKEEVLRGKSRPTRTNYPAGGPKRCGTSSSAHIGPGQSRVRPQINVPGRSARKSQTVRPRSSSQTGRRIIVRPREWPAAFVSPRGN